MRIYVNHFNFSDNKLIHCVVSNFRVVSKYFDLTNFVKIPPKYYIQDHWFYIKNVGPMAVFKKTLP